MDEQELHVFLAKDEPACAELLDAKKKLIRITSIPVTELYTVDDVARYSNDDGVWVAGSVIYRRYPKRTELKISAEDHARLEERWEDLGCKTIRRDGKTIVAHKEDVDPYAVLYAEGVFVEDPAKAQ